MLPYPVYLQNDATAACGAELAFGDHAELLDFIYFYIGAFVGGGLVLNGGLFAGRTGNAAALGSMPVPGRAPAARSQLIDRRLAGAARAPAARRRPAGRGALRSRPPTGTASAPVSTTGSPTAARGIAHAVAAATRHHRLRGGGHRRRLPRRCASACSSRVAAELRRLDLSGIVAAGAPRRQHRPDRPRPRRRQPAALRPLPARPAHPRRPVAPAPRALVVTPPGRAWHQMRVAIGPDGRRRWRRPGWFNLPEHASPGLGRRLAQGLLRLGVQGQAQGPRRRATGSSCNYARGAGEPAAAGHLRHRPHRGPHQLHQHGAGDPHARPRRPARRREARPAARRPSPTPSGCGRAGPATR